jgi:hypothetical protein
MAELDVPRRKRRPRSLLRRGAVRALIITCLSIGFWGCGSQEGGEVTQESSPRKSIDQVLEDHNEELLAIEGVIGTGITGDEERSVILVIVESRDDEILGHIPPHLEGHPIIIVDAQQIREMTGLDDP